MHHEVLFFADFWVSAIDHDLNVVSEPHGNATVGLMPEVYLVELEVIWYVVDETPWGLKVPHQIDELISLRFIYCMLNWPNELNSDALMVQGLLSPFREANDSLSFDIFSILQYMINNQCLRRKQVLFEVSMDS